MNRLCYELLEGTLIWEGNKSSYSTTISNQLPVPISLEYAPNPGSPMPSLSGSPPGYGGPTINPGASLTISSSNNDYPPGYYKAIVTKTGALVNVFDCSAASPSVMVDQAVLNSPNDIGPIPVPTASIVEPVAKASRPNSTMVVPPDSPRVLVGCGTAVNGNLVTREQYWARQNDSLCLAGHETRTVSYTVTSGMQQTSSDTKTMAMSLDSSVSGGWGPVSASISGSLSQGSTSFQQVTVTQETNSYVSNIITNPHPEPIAYLRWQLVDVITVFDRTSGQPLSCLMQGANPTLVMGPYWVSPRPPALGSGAERGSGLFEYK